MPRKTKTKSVEETEQASSGSDLLNIVSIDLDEKIIDEEKKSDVPGMVVKKKRGRKPKEELNEKVEKEITEEENTTQTENTEDLELTDENQQTNEPKKRGRKPKPKDPKDDEPKEAKKRGRKPKDKVYTVNSAPIAPKFNFADENIILHIPIQDEDLINHQAFGDKDFLEYNPNLSDPKPFDTYDAGLAPLKNSEFLGVDNFERIDDDEDDNLEGDVVKSGGEQNKVNFAKMMGIQSNSMKMNIPVEKSSPGITPMGDEPLQKEFPESPRVSKRKMYDIMYEFVDKKQKDYWPERTDIFCYWCCHGFNTRPLGMPVKFKNGKFFLSRNYCSWNCMISHLFQLKEYDMYEKYQLINYMYSKIYDCPPVKIRPAPAREVLKVFGGFLTIEEFRESALLFNKKYEVMYPPLTSMIPQVEECTMEIASNKKKEKSFVPVDQNLLDRVQKTLKLKRDKPLVNNKHTLESYMDIKVI